MREERHGYMYASDILDFLHPIVDKMRRSMVFMLVMSTLLLAEQASSCLERLKELQQLKAQRVSGIEKTAGFLLSGGFLGFSDDQEEELLEERIRVLEFGLKSCR